MHMKLKKKEIYKQKKKTQIKNYIYFKKKKKN